MSGLEIKERMYSIREVADLSGHSHGYVLALIQKGELEATQPSGPSGRPGRWRVYPASIRKWLGIHEKRSPRSKIRKAANELAAFMAFTNQREIVNRRAAL